MPIENGMWQQYTARAGILRAEKIAMPMAVKNMLARFEPYLLRGMEVMRLMQVSLRWLGFIITGLLGLYIISQIILRLRSMLRPRPIPVRLAGVLSSSLRRKCFGAPEEIIKRSGVTPGMRVLEIGPGPGYFTPALARCVASQGEQGSVTCVEIQPAMIEMLRQRLHKEQITNVEIVQGDGQKLPLPAESFDLIFLVTVIGEVPDAQALFHQCAQVLKPGGILAVTEQVFDSDFHQPGFVHNLARIAELEDVSYSGSRWWVYTARYRKPVLVPNLEYVV
jgi:protein-L-isoaspartate O-methyltransferase